MDRELRILILEDVDADAELAQHELRKAGLKFVSRLVSTKKDFVTELDRFAPDIILGDARLPSFDGLSALAITREKRPGLPFIFVTGTMGEEWAIESLKRGANDYVLKQRLSKLAPVVKRAFQEAKEAADRKKAQERVSKINGALLSLTADPADNIQSLVTLCGEIMGAVCVVYNRVEGEYLCAAAAWHAPEGLERRTKAHGHICFDVVNRGKDDVQLVRNLPQTSYFETDPNVAKYGLETYVGKSVKRKGGSVGCLCTLYKKDYVPEESDKEAMGIITSSIGVEEERLAYEEELRRHRDHLEELVKERTAEISKLNERLLELAEEAKQASKAKSDFIANMSHELRTPMNSVLGFAQLLDTECYGPLNEKQKEYVKDVLESGQHLMCLINEVLDISKIEAGKLELKPAKMNLKEILNNSITILGEKAKAHSIKYELIISPAVPSAITADDVKVKQVLFNFLSNAFKFTPDRGEIMIEAVKISEKEIEISVTDNGPAIKKEDQEKLFTPFTKLDEKKSGTGLGLSLSKKMVNLWGGKIGAVSPLEGKKEGCRFYFTIPI